LVSTAHHRIARRQELLGRRVEVAKLGVAIGMLAAFSGLAIPL
jgi:hypothetical protein